MLNLSEMRDKIKEIDPECKITREAIKMICKKYLKEGTEYKVEKINSASEYHYYKIKNNLQAVIYQLYLKEKGLKGKCSGVMSY